MRRLHSFWLLFLLFSHLCSSPVSVGGAEDASRLLAEMPDIRVDPEGYRAWKLRYARLLSRAYADASSGLARVTAPTDWYAGNGYVRADVDETTGEFDEGGDPTGSGSYVKLTFSWPDSPGTEWVMYYVDGTWAKTDAALPNTSSNYMIGNTVYSIWNNWNGVYIRQEICPVSLGTSPGENEQIKFKAVMKPADGSCHNCGCIVYYDTMLDWNDAAEISTAFGYTGIAEIFFAPNIPPIWRAYENGYPPSPGDLVALGILIGFEATMPDVFWYGSWPSSVGNGWDDADWTADTGSSFGDSATMVKWYPRYVCPGDSVVFVTYYGIGNISGTGLTLSHTPPDVTASCLSVSPDPMTLTAIVTNMGTADAHNVTVTLDLSGSSLVYVGGDPTSTYFSSIAGYGGSVTVNWQVDIPPSAYGSVQCYTITVTYDEGGPITQNYCVTIPNLLSPPTPSAWADSYTICAGECTYLHADPDTGGGGSCDGYSSNFNSDNGGFSGTGSWQWGAPTYGPTSAHSTPYCWGTNLSGDYSNSANWTLTSPPIDLSGCSSAVLTFWHWYNIESYWDGGNVKISTDGGATWNLITPVGDYPEDAASSSNSGIPGEACYSASSGGWVMATFDLTPYVGGTIRLRWHFGSDGSVTYPGWYIDDVVVSGSGGGGGSWTWSWSPATGLSDPTSTDPQACPSTTTTYTFTVTDGIDCTGSASVTINVVPRPVVTVADRTICYGESTTLSASITGSYTSILWSTGETGVTFITVSPTTTTSYWVEVCNGGCCDRDTAVVTVSPQIIVDCGPEPAQVCEGSSITLSATVSGGTPGYIYTWFPSTGLDNPMSPTPNASPTTSTWYYCTVTDAFGCDATDSVFVEVLPAPTPPVLISIPNGAVDVPPGDTCLYWHSVPGVTYDVYFDGGLVASGITDTFWCTTLACDETHTWSVSATNTCGSESSPTWTFSTMTSPAGLALVSPANGESDIPPGTVTLDWTDATGSSPITYELYVNGALVASGLTTSQFDITVACDDTISWYVVASNICGSQTSPTWTFYAQTSPRGVALVSPWDGTSEVPAGTVTLDWNPPTSGSGPFTYDVYVNGVPVATGIYEDQFDITVACDDTISWFVVASNLCGSDTSEVWTFYTQTSPDAPVLIFPPADTSFATGSVGFVWHASSGSAPITYVVIVNGETLATTTDTTATGYGDCGESYEWYVVAVNACGEASSEPQSFTIFPCSGPSVSIVEPLAGTWSACVDQNIVIAISDSDGVDVSSIVLAVDADTFTVDGVVLSYSSDTLVFVPPAGWSDGESVYVCLVDAADVYDNHIDAPVCWYFRVDLSPPYAWDFNPPDGAVITDPSPTISCFLDDTLSGLDETSITLSVTWSGGTQEFGVGDAGASWSPPTFVVNLSDVGIEFAAGEVVQVCISAADMPDYCPPNELDTCWSFQLASEAPVAELLTPQDGVFLSCADQQILLRITSSIGIDESTIRFVVNGDTMGTSDPRLSWSPDTLRFVPSPLWSDGEVVSWALIAANDVLGDSLAAPLSGTFTVDLTPPAVIDFSPASGETVITPSPGVWVVIVDSISGVDSTTLSMTVNGAAVSPTVSDSSYGGLTFWTLTYDGIFSHNDTVNVCVYAADAVDTSYCPANSLEHCFWFVVDLYGPVAGGLEDPASGGELDGAISACADQGFCFELVDTEISHGVDPASIIVLVNGDTHTVGDGELTYDGERVCFLPESLFADGEVVSVVLAAATDFPGNPLATTYSWSYSVDLSAPYVPPGAWPPPGSEIATLTPVVTFDLVDALSGVALGSVQICISISGGAPSCYTLGDAGISHSGTSWSADFATMGITLSGGDVVQFCISATDTPDFCPPNELDTCWSFSVPVGGPRATPLEPLDSTFSACDDQKIIIRLADLDGVDESTILLSVNGTHYTTSDPELVYYASSDSLVFTPPSLWTDGEAVVCSLLSASDVFGNPLEDAPVVWSFVVDLSPPTLAGISPSPGAHVLGDFTTIEVDIADAYSGVSDTLVWVSVDGVVFGVSDPCVSWSGSHFTLDLACAGITPERGDTLQICLHAGDKPDYCPPNETDTCYLVWIMECDLAVSIEMDDTVICHPSGSVSFTIDATVSGGVGPYSYSWSPPDACVDSHVEDVVAVPPYGVTEYIVQVTDATGCTAYDTVYVTVTDPQVDAGGDISVCPDGVALLECTALSGTAIEPVSITWHDLDGVVYSTEETFSFEPESTVVLVVDVVDGVGCAASDTIIVRYEHDAPGPFTYHIPASGDTVAYGEPVTLCWEMPEGDAPVYFDLYVDGSAVATGITDTCFDVGPFGCGETHTWHVESYNLCLPLDCRGDTCGYYAESLGVDTLCGVITVPGDTFAGGVDPSFHTQPCPTGTPEIVEPLESTWSTCDDQPIIIRIAPPDSGLPLDEASFRLTVEGSTYVVDGVVLSWSEPLLVFNPPSPWLDGQVVDVCLDSATDIAGTPVEGLPLCWSWFVDLSPPVFWNESPSGATSNPQASVSVSAIDSLRAVEPTSLSLTIGGVFGATGEVTLHYGDPAVAFDGTTFVIDPSSADPTELGVDYSWCDDSQLVGGIYFPEGETISVVVSASDLEPDYCEPNWGSFAWSFWVVDDDTTPPAFSNFSPAYVSTQVSFGISVDVCDESGVLGGEPFAPFAVYDTDGEVEASCDTVWLSVSDCWTDTITGLTCCRLVSTANVGPFDDTTTVLVRVFAHDGDYDFCNDADPLLGWSDFVVPVLAGPRAEPLEPLPGSITACDDQQIRIRLWDPDGVDLSSITLAVGDSAIAWGDPRLTYDTLAQELIFTPQEGYFFNEELVTVSLTGVLDVLGNPMWDTLSFSFAVDLEPPALSLVFPSEGMMVRTTAPDIAMNVSDNLAGVDVSSIVVSVNGIDYSVDGAVVLYDPATGELVFQSDAAGLVFPPGDTVWLSLHACDAPDYCAPNCNDTLWWFSVEPEVGCYIHPNPFTPNDDGRNDIVVFDYPYMFSEPAEIRIFDLRNVEVYRGQIGPISAYEDFDLRMWDGRDKNGNPLPPGLYVYIITRGGEIICDGTVVLMR